MGPLLAMGRSWPRRKEHCSYKAMGKALSQMQPYLGLNSGAGCVTVRDSLGLLGSQPLLCPSRGGTSSLEILWLWALLSLEAPTPCPQ